MWRRRLFALALVSLATQGSAIAQVWPTRSVRVIVPVTAGSALDITARTVSDQLARQLGQTFVVENRTGAGGTTGATAVAKSDPDGYTILIHSSAITIHPATFLNLAYDTARDFSGVMPIIDVPLILVVSPNKYKSLPELIAAGKAKAGAMNYASVGYGAAAHLTSERLRLAAGFEAQHIPFRGAPEALTEVLAERVDFFYTPILPALPMLREGKLKALATSSPKRSLALPDVPTTLEAGLRNSDFSFWLGMFVPARTPREVVDKLYQETRKSVQTDAAQEKFRTLGGEPMSMSPAEFDALIRKEQSANAELAKAAGIKPN
jgi:tripartite-type tricarboxylate transporter receptor subunit TctC